MPPEKGRARGLIGLFLMIAEPRVSRVIQLFIYLAILGAAIASFVAPPPTTVWVLGPALTAMWSGFLLLGGLLGTIAVLPGIWWLERAAVIGACAGIAIYCVVLVALQVADGTQLFIAIALLLNQAHRWTTIRRYQLAPKG